MITPRTPLTARGRFLSLIEFLLGAFVVLGHNVFRILPNEVPILVVAGWISLRLRKGGWKAAGFRRPNSWWKTVALAVGGAVVLQAGGELILGPLISRIWPEPQQLPQILNSTSLGWKQALITLLIVWTFAAFGEELSYRGYLLTRAAEFLGQSRAAYVLAAVLIAVLFGFGHYYKGPAGVADSTYSGLVYGAVFLLSGRNLWAPILAHGISDTFALLVVFMGGAA
ncbi:MAG TPA: CPBP family intramembrane glutamic endopeptidase [Chthoniobacterales bacterium]|nr:CPBP family intramembrane glutamic endopeptidase [Chthoniobacterales bacterium]